MDGGVMPKKAKRSTAERQYVMTVEDLTPLPSILLARVESGHEGEVKFIGTRDAVRNFGQQLIDRADSGESFVLQLCPDHTSREALFCGLSIVIVPTREEAIAMYGQDSVRPQTDSASAESHVSIEEGSHD